MKEKDSEQKDSKEGNQDQDIPDPQKQKKRLLIATDGWLPRWDGIVRFLFEIVPRLEEKYEIRILAPTFEGKYRKPLDVEIFRFPQLKVRFGDIFFSKIRAKQLAEHVDWADILFVQSLGTIGMATINAASRKKPVIFFTHLIEWDLATKSLKRFKKIVNIVVKLFVRRYYKKCAMLIHPTEEVRHIYRKNRVLVRSEIINLGTDTGKFRPAVDKKKAKSDIGLNPGHIIIGYHGRIGREKDLLTMYRAFRRLEKDHENIRLMIVGKGVEEQERVFSSDRNIILPGSKLDVVPYLQAMDMYVLPSLTETSSLSTMEAMACGLAVVTTPVGYVKEYIQERENGMLFPFSNSMRLAMKLKLLVDDEELRLRLGRNARITIKKNFSWDKTAEKILNVLKRF